MPTECPASGRIDATVAVRYDTVGSAALSGFKAKVGYPASALSLPNPDGAFVDAERLTDLTGQQAFIVVQDGDANGDGTEDTADVVYALTNLTFDPGPVVGLSFDCVAGSSALPTQFTCAVEQASDLVGNDAMNPSTIPCSVVSLTPH